MEPVSYHISYEDQLSFAVLHQTRSMKSFTLFIIGLVFFVTLMGYLRDSPSAAIGAAAGGIFALIAMFILARFILVPWHTKRAYRDFKMIQEEMTLSLSDESFTIDQASGNVTAQWENMVKWDENERILAFYPQRQMAYIFPKAALGNDRIAHMRAKMVKSGLPKKGKLRK